MTKRSIIAVVLLITSVCYAGNIGSPVATLEAGKSSIGAELSSQRQNIQIYGTDTFDGVLEDVRSQSATAVIAHGVTDKVNLFGKLGYIEGDNYDGVRNITAGATATLAENLFIDDLSLGMTGQFSLARIETDTPVTIGKCWWKRTIDVPLEINMTETILALGLNYDYGDLSVYGGPAIYHLDGDIETNTSLAEDGSIKEDTSIIGYVGASYEVYGITLTGEYAFGSDFQNIGVGVIWQF